MARSATATTATSRATSPGIAPLHAQGAPAAVVAELGEVALRQDAAEAAATKIARGRDNARDEEGAEDEGGQGFQEACDVVCIDGGASSLSSRGEVKRLSRVVYAAQPSADV